MLPEELCLGTWRDTPSGDEDLKASVQNIEEVRLQAATNLSAYQDETRRWKNKKFRPKLIRSGDLVLHKVPKGKLKGKMHGKCEGPFISTTTASNIQVASVDRRRRALHLECGHASEILHLKSL
jgi:Fe-S cluster biogenesis protein NfuA